tara:strand:- start:115 stop:459 length:345 start_codon:yes stop_codon:yes gene_type:complete
MKITKRQLKQMIKEAIGGDRDVEWLTADELRKNPRSKMAGASPIAGQEEENFHTVDFMINFYQEKPRAWNMAEYHYHEMAHGNDPEGIRSEMYPDWSDEDFAEVIRAISPRGEY